MNLHTLYLAFIVLFLFSSCKKPQGGTDNVDDVLPIHPDIEQEGLLFSKPAFPGVDGEVTIYFDADRGNAGLKGHQGDVFVHIGLITSASTHPGDWKYVKSEWNENLPATKM